MKKIVIKFMGMSPCKKCQAKVTICDLKGCVLANGYTNNGAFCFYGKLKNFYKVWFNINGIRNCKTIYINGDTCYPIYYQSIIASQRTITFLLTDQSYANLPIDKGELIVWQK